MPAVGELDEDLVDPRLEHRTRRVVFWRIVPLCFILYVIAYLDRSNIGYAALQMNRELALSSEAFGLASGIFFIGYFLFEIPSNVLLVRFGARIWITRILVSWSVLVCLEGMVQTPLQLYVLRFLLGIAEAGFFPGIIVYLTYWFSAKDRASAIACFTTAIPASYIIGASSSTWIMQHLHLFGISGWRWMLVLEGILALLGGIGSFFLLLDSPAQARWLTGRQRAWLVEELRRDDQAVDGAQHLSIMQAIWHPKVLLLSLVYLVYQSGSLGIGYWMPQIIHALSARLSEVEIGLVAVIPYLVAMVAMVLWSRRSDSRNERKLHAALPLLLAAIALLLAGLVRQPILALSCVTAALTGLYSFKSPFWAIPNLFLHRSTAAVSVAIINSIGNLGGFLGPFLIGVVKERTGSALSGLLFLSGLLLVAFLLTVLMRLPMAQRTNPASKPELVGHA